MNAFQHIFFKITKNSHYKTDQNGIINRYFVEKNNWEEHLDNSKQYILNFISDCVDKNIAILGSGWLLDVPVNEILRKNNKLYLFDINHPKQLVKKYGNEKNIEFVKADLTNNLVAALTYAKKFNEFAEIVTNVIPLNFNKYDFVISLNLLNQLDILLCDLLKKKFNITDTALIDIRQAIQQKHLFALPKGKSCIITDYSEINYRQSISDGKVKQLIYTPFDNLRNKKEWFWNFDTKRTYKQGFKTMFKVVAGEV